jgi:signal transduction histidine kinase
MKFSLKAKLTAVITWLVMLVVLISSSLYLSHLIRLALVGVETKGEYVANEIYHQASTALAQSRLPAGTDPSNLHQVRRFIQARLAADQGLSSLMESAIGYSATLYYVAITDSDHQILIHSDLDMIGKRLAPSPQPFSSLLNAGLVRQLRVIYGRPQVYEVVLPLDVSGQPLGEVRVGVSTLFLGDQIMPDLRAAVILSSMLILFATLFAGLLSYRILRPLESIARGVDRLARGEFSPPLELKRADEWGILSSKLDLLGEHMRGEKAAFLRLKDNLDQLFSKLSDGLLFFDRQDNLVLATPAVWNFLGCSPESLVHRRAAEIFSSDHPLHQLLSKAFRTQQSLPWQTLELPGEEASRVAVTMQFVEVEEERVGCLVTLRDASTRAEIENQIDIAAKLAAVSRLTSGVAHEVKNPLNAMVLQLEILKSKLADQTDQVEPQLNVLTSEIRRLDRVVKTFLDFTRPVEIHPTETDIETLVREVFTLAEPQARENRVRLVFEQNGALPAVQVDRDLMKQALLNLVLNGCQAMPSGGELKIVPRVKPHRLELEIADQGVGIPPEARQKIFSLFFTTKPQGNGIGLAMTFRILQLHNASIDFSSEVNRGTTFRVSLPC